MRIDEDKFLTLISILSGLIILTNQSGDGLCTKTGGINTRLKVRSQILVLRKRFSTYSGSVFQQNRVVFAPDSPRVPNKLHGTWMHIWIVQYILYSNIRSRRSKVPHVCIFSPTTFYSSFGSSHKFDSIEIIMFIYSLFFCVIKQEYINIII